jgi:mercuric ion binding protein
MNFSKSILTIALASITLFGCKDKATDATSEKETATAKKEIAVAVKPETASFKIEGMSCAIGCAKTIEKELADMNGVQNAKVDFDTKQATVNFDADKLSSADLIKTVEAAADGKTYKVSEIKTTANKA